MRVSLEIHKAQYEAAQAALTGVRDGVRRALAGAVNDTAKKGKIEVIKRIRAKVAIKRADIANHLTLTRATPAKPESVLTVARSKRLPLKYFGARQTRKGVTYRINKVGGRKLVPSAFIVDSLGSQVYRRQQRGLLARLFGTGKGRLPIFKLFGPSAGAVAEAQHVDTDTTKILEPELEKNFDRRVNVLLLKAQGAI